jgi:hypothetical protein
MAQKHIVLVPPDSLRTGFAKVEDNITELYALVATLGDKQETAPKQRKNPVSYGVVSDGLPHPLSERFLTLNDAKAIYPKALSQAEQIDDNAWRLTLDLAVDAKTGVEVPVGTTYSTTGQVITGWLYGLMVGRYGAPTIDGPGSRHARFRNLSANYALTYSLADNVNQVFDMVSVGGMKFTTQNGGGVEFLAGVGQSDIHHLEFDGMGTGKFAIQCLAANDMFMSNIHDNRFISEEFPFNGGILNLTGAVTLNIDYHDNFATHMKANAANIVLNNALNCRFAINQFEHTGGITNNSDHTFISLTGFSFTIDASDNYLEGTWGCFLRAGAAGGALIGVNITGFYGYEYDETIAGGGTPSPIIGDFRNLTKNAHVDNVNYLNGCVAFGGGYLFPDLFHAMDGEGVHRFRNNSTGNQAKRFVEPLLVGLDHTGTMVSVHNPNETYRRSGRGVFPANADQGVGNLSNFTIFLPTDVPATRGAWVNNRFYSLRDTVTASGNVYEARTSGLSGPTTPTGTNPAVDVGDGLLLWRYLRSATVDANKIESGAYDLDITAEDAIGDHALTAFYKVIFDDKTIDYAIAVAEAYDLTVVKPGKPTTNELLFAHTASRDFYFPINMAGSQARGSIAATAQTDFLLKRAGTTIATIRFAAGSPTATFIAAAAIHVAPGDFLTILAPATPDATLQDIGITFKGEIMYPRGTAPRYMAVSVTAQGVVSVSVTQGVALGQKLSFSWRKRQSLV